MEKIKKIKEALKRENIDGYIIPKTTNFSGNIYQITMIDLVIFQILQVHMDFL